MSNNQFSPHDNVKKLDKVLEFPSKLLLGKNMFTLTFVDLEYENSVSISEFETMIVLNKFAFISARYTIKFTKHK